MLFIIIILLVTFLIFLKSTKVVNLTSELKQIDNLIQLSEEDQATEELYDLLDSDLDRYNYYRIVKRAITISSNLDDYSILYTVSKSAIDTYPGEEGFFAYNVMSLLKLDRPEEAFELASKYLISEEFKPLLAQATLYKDKNNKSTTEYIRETKDPVYYEYLANLLDNNSLYINSSLLWAEQGDIEKAYKLLKTIDNELTQEAIALLSYDSGRRSESLLRLLSLPVTDSIKIYNLNLIADLFYLDENWSRSKYYYEKVLEIDPYNGYAYINISSILYKSDQVKQSLDILREGQNNLKEIVLLITSEIQELKIQQQEVVDSNQKNLIERTIIKKTNELKLFRNDLRNIVLLFYNQILFIDEMSAVRSLENFKSIFPDDVKIDLLIMKNKNRLYIPEVFEARLWDLLNKDQDNKEVSEYLIWYLLGLGNYESARLVLERSEHRSTDSNWTNYYRAILNGLEGNYELGLDYLQRLKDNSIATWEIYYTKAILNIGNGNLTEALELLNHSLISINQIDYLNNRTKYLSEIKTKIAEVLISLNDIDEAIRILNSAYELNPNNYRSDLLRSININIKEKS